MNAAAWRLRWIEASLALRIGAAVALFGLVVAGAAAAMGYWALSRQLDARLEAELDGKRDLLLHLLSEMPDVQAIAAHGHRFGDLLIGHNDLHLGRPVFVGRSRPAHVGGRPAGCWMERRCASARATAPISAPSAAPIVL